METSLIKEEYPQEDFILYNNVLQHSNNMLNEKDLNNSVNNSEENEDNLQKGRWNNDEHIRFIKGCLLYKNNWKKVKKYVKTRSSAQIRSHAQKYLIKLKKKFQSDFFSKDFFKFDKNDNNIFDIDLINKINFNNLDIMEKVERNILNIFKSNSNSSNLNYGMDLDELNYKNINESIEKKDTDSTSNSREKIFKLIKVPRKKKKEIDSNEYLNKKRHLMNNSNIDFSNLYSNSIPNNYGVDPVKMAEIEKFVHKCLDSTDPEDLKKLLLFFQENPILNQNLNFITPNFMFMPNNKEIGYNDIGNNFNDINNDLSEISKNNYNFFQNNGFYNLPINDNIFYPNYPPYIFTTPSQFQHSFNN